MMTDEEIDLFAEAAKQKRVRNARNWYEAEWIRQDVDKWKSCMKVFKRYCDEANRYRQHQQQMFANWLAQQWR